MDDSLHAALREWTDFYLITGTAAAALTGLQFVTMALFAEVRHQTSSGDGVSAFGTPNVVHFSIALLVSCTLSAPWRSMHSAAMALIVIGLAGLAYAYGGATTSLLAVVGYHTNSMLWLPLVLVAVERARTRPLAACLVGGALAYAPSVLGGYGQGFLYVGIAAVSYALFLSLFVGPALLVAVTARLDRRERALQALFWTFGFISLGRFNPLVGWLARRWRRSR